METLKGFRQSMKEYGDRIISAIEKARTKPQPQPQPQPEINLNVSNNNDNTNNNTITTRPPVIINNNNNNNNNNNTSTTGGGQAANHQNNGTYGGQATNGVQSPSIEPPTKGGDARNGGGTEPQTKTMPDSSQPSSRMEKPANKNNQSDDSRLLEEATNQYNELLATDPNPSIEKIKQAGVVPGFVEILSKDDFPQLQFEAASTLTKIVVGTSDNIKLVIDQGAIPVFVKLLGSPNNDVREQATEALGLIADDSTRCRNLVLDNGALPPLLAEMNEHAKLSLLRKATETLSKCCYQPRFDQIKPALPALGAVIKFSDDEEVLANACWALSHLSDRKYGNSQAVIEAGACPWLLQHLRHPSPLVLAPVLSTVGNIVDGDSHIQAAIDANIIGPVVHLLQHAASDVKEWAASVIKRATLHGTREQIKYFVSQGCIKPLCDLLICSDEGILIASLDGLENILKAGEADKNWGNTGGVNLYAGMIDEAEGLKKIENLESHDRKKIKEKAVKLRKTYWSRG